MLKYNDSFSLARTTFCQGWHMCYRHMTIRGQVTNHYHLELTWHWMETELLIETSLFFPCIPAVIAIETEVVYTISSTLVW